MWNSQSINVKLNNLEIGWYRNGYDICYYQNNMKRKNNGYYYTLTIAFKLNCKI